ncbi:MAG: hypothetical protein IJP14_03560 [Clostridia bacterium]|nr:hypothetical protein [Clostridia bacterium]
MKTCTFFGHADTPSSIIGTLEDTIVELINVHSVTRFYVGNHGNFDTLVAQTLCRLKKQYPHIQYAVVLAYLPSCALPYPTVFPEGIESVPPRFAIVRRNEWMLKRSDFVITYVHGTVGGSARFKKLAERQRKTVINLYDPKPTP